jgi:hypothetical protein
VSTDSDGDDLTEETRAMVARARERAAQAPSAEQLATLLSAAGERRTGSTSEEVRRLASAAIHQAGQVSYLLGQLSGLLDEADGDPDV